MNLHINFLEKAECRYQSRVDFSRLVKRMLLGTTVLTIVLVLIASGLKVKRSTALGSLEKEWAGMEKKVAELNVLDAASTANTKTYRSLRHSLEGTHEPRGKLLDVIQASLPEKTRLKHLFIGEEKGYDTHLYNVIRLVGESRGDGGELLPVRWKRDLSKKEDICSVAGEIMLDGEVKPMGERHWSFTLRARSLVEGK